MQLNTLQIKVDLNYAWLAKLPDSRVNPDILDTAVALADAIAGYKQTLQTTSPTEAPGLVHLAVLNL